MTLAVPGGGGVAEDVEGLPWPQGDPGAARAAARRAHAVALGLHEARGTIGPPHVDGWSGNASWAFAGTTLRNTGTLDSGAAALTEAAGALNELAGRLEHAQHRVRVAAKKLRAAREAHARAAAAAATARDLAHAAHQQAQLDLSTPLYGASHAAAQSAAHDAARAGAAESAASDDLATISTWAQNEASDACHDAAAADQRCAAALEAAAGAPGAISPTTTTPTANATPGGPLGPLGQFLGADAFNYWSGGDHESFPFGTAAMAGLKMNGIRKWMPLYNDWKQISGIIAPAQRGAQMTLDEAAYARMMEGLPVFNNGLVGRTLARSMSGSQLGNWLSNASKATPFFRRAGIVGGVVSTGMDAYGLVQQGNPVDAFKEDGAGYVADVGKTAFSASSTAFLIAPNPVTGGAVVISGAIWAGAEAWDHREQIANGAKTAANWAWDHSAVGVAFNHRQDIANAFNSGVDMAQDLAGDVHHTLDTGVDTVKDGLSSMGSSAVDGGKDLLNGVGGLFH